MTTPDLTSATETDDGPSASAPEAPAEAPAARPALPSVPDAVALAAVDVARAAAVEAATLGLLPGDRRVGEHVGARAEGSSAAVHHFVCLDAGYSGWVWAVEVAHAPDGDQVTVDDVVCVPGPTALLPPPWVPWAQRVQPSDLGPGDLLASPADDPRLVLRPADVRSWSDEGVWMGDGIGRPRLLSQTGRDDAADRWWEGAHGPAAPAAQQAPGTCGGCGFYLRVEGSLGRLFGVCANDRAPADGTVVAVAYGCGAHSEAVADPTVLWQAEPLALGHETFEVLELSRIPLTPPPHGAPLRDARVEDITLVTDQPAVEHAPAGEGAGAADGTVDTDPEPLAVPAVGEAPTPEHATGEPADVAGERSSDLVEASDETAAQDADEPAADEPAPTALPDEVVAVSDEADAEALAADEAPIAEMPVDPSPESVEVAAEAFTEAAEQR